MTPGTDFYTCWWSGSGCLSATSAKYEDALNALSRPGWETLICIGLQVAFSGRRISTWAKHWLYFNKPQQQQQQTILSLTCVQTENGLIQPEKVLLLIFWRRGRKSMNYMWESIMSNDVSEAVEIRSDLHSNGVGDQVDRWFWSCAGEQIDGSAAGWRCFRVCVGAW